MFQIGRAPGIISEKMLPISPVAETMRYVGINPPENSIAPTKYHMKTFLG